MTAYDEWPFRPPDKRSRQENEAWWARCYVPGVADRQLAAADHWTLLTGPPQSGKSAALLAWRQDEAGRSLVVDYPPNVWPGQRGAWFADEPDHLPQMLAAAGLAARDRLVDDPAAAAGLRGLEREFLRWLLLKMGGARMYGRLVAQLPAAQRAEYEALPPVEDLYPSFDEPQHVFGLIDDLGLLAGGLGYERVVFVADVPGADAPGGIDYGDALGDLFGWLDLAHYPRLAVVAAAPEATLAAGRVLNRARGRAGLITTRWREDECRHIAERHLGAALGLEEGQMALERLAAPEVVARLGATIAREYGGPSPGGWVTAAETLLFQSTYPPTPPATADAAALWFARHMKLRLDESRQAVWRGPRLIPLDDQPFRFLSLLHRRRGVPASWYDDDVRDIAGSQGNTNTLASRVRKDIEPMGKPWIYLKNDHSKGYWLENTL